MAICSTGHHEGNGATIRAMVEVWKQADARNTYSNPEEPTGSVAEQCHRPEYSGSHWPLDSHAGRQNARKDYFGWEITEIVL